MSSLRRHIPEIAIDWLLDTPDARWRAIEGTLSFSDISGFTALAERLAQRGRIGGEELIETLSGVFATMLDVAHARGGVLLKFGGDALLLFFDGPGHAERAAAAAVEMRAALRRAADKPTSVGPMRLSMSVGIHSADALFFLVGSTHRELVLLGPPINTVIETETAAESGEILLSAATAARLPAAASVVRDDGRALLRWRKPPSGGLAPRPQRPIDDAALRTLFPRALGAHLERGPPEPEHRMACMAFVKVSGTDAFLGTHGPDALAAALHETVSAAQAALDAEAISLLTIDADRDGAKFFLGSGVPIAHEDDEGAMLRALRAVMTASTPLPLQAGVNRGHVFAAEVGAPRRAAYSAMGDTTNTAARIASKAPSGTIYAHPSVLDQSLTLFETRAAGPLVLKGKKAPLAVYEIGEETGSRRREGLEAAEFVGRERERVLLQQAIHRLRSGSGGLFTLIGATGAGKSRLIRESLADAPTTIALRAEPYGAASPYRLFRDPFRALLGIERGEPRDMAAAFERRVRDLCPEVAPLASLLGEIAHVDIEPSETVNALQPNFRAERRAAAAIELIARVHPGPILFVVDDAHWADEASVELLRAFARATTERPWLIVVARRDIEGGFRPDASHEVTIGPLDDDALRRLVDAATEAAPLRPDETKEVLRRVGGNPLFAMELLRAIREVGSLDAVPSSLEAAMATQIDTLDPAARKVLRYATVLGRSFSRSVLAEILATEHDEGDLTSLDRLGDYLEADGRERLRFRNSLLRDVVYEGVAYRLRKRLHRVAGETMERLAPDPALVADSLALHFSHGDDPEKTWRYARAAAERARKAYANLDAANMYEIALAARAGALEDREVIEAWVALGDVRELAGQFEESLGSYRRALELVGDEPNRRAELLLKRARAKERAARFSEALRDLTSGKRLLLQSKDAADAGPTLAKLESFSAMVFMGQDRHRDALKAAERAIEIARSHAEKESEARALIVTEMANMVINGPGDGAHLERALAIAEELGDLNFQSTARGNLGVLHLYAGRWNEALSWLTSAIAIDRRRGDAMTEAVVALAIAEIYISQGRIDEAVPLVQNGLRSFRASAWPEGIAEAELQLARIHLAREEYAVAAELATRVMQEFESSQPRYALEAALLLSDARRGSGNAEAALEVVDRALAADSDVGMSRAKAACSRALALAALGRFEESEVEIEAGLKVADEQRLVYERALLLSARRAITESQGNEPDPRDIADAAAAFDVLGVVRPPATRVRRIN